MHIDPFVQWLLGSTLAIYMIVMYVVGYVAQRRIVDVEDFLVAGRRLPLSLAWMTLLATWFGAGTLLTAADEVRVGGLQRAALDPFGAGACLIIAALFVAGPMWRMQLLTVPDFFRRKFGSAAELLSSIILVPSYFGWIAAQFTALAGVLNLFFGVPLEWGLLVVAVAGTGYTLMGGMWAVTLTDAVQISLVLAGLVLMVGVILLQLGGGDLWYGMLRIVGETDPQLLKVIPTDTAAQLIGWLGVFAIGALGNLPGQDLMQRIFAARSASTARAACLVAGLMYLLFGCLPLVLALAGNILFPQQLEESILPVLAPAFLHPIVAVIFLVALLSAILSTIDSAILSPAGVLAQNVFPRYFRADMLKSNRLAVLFVGCSSLLLAYSGQSAYELLEEAYLLTLVGLFVPMMVGLYSAPASGLPANCSMLVGTAIWALHFGLGWESFGEPWKGVLGTIPVSLAAPGLALLTYFALEPPWRIVWQRSAMPEHHERLGKDQLQDDCQWERDV